MIRNEDTMIIDKLNAISLNGLDKIKLGDMLAVPIEWSKNKSNINIIKTIVKILFKIIFKEYKLDIVGKPNTVVFFATTYKRVDHLRYFANFTSLFSDKCIIQCCKRSFTLSHFKYFYNVFIWNKQLKVVVNSLSKRLYLITYLLEAFLISEDYNKIFNLYDDLIVYCDFQPVDSYLVQYFNSHNKVTISLQHGVYSSKFPIWFTYSHSKYVIAANKYTIDETIKLGYNGVKFIIAGPLQYLNKKITISNVKSNDEFNNVGILLDGKLNDEINNTMIALVKDICNKYNKNLYIRLHPTCDLSLYKHFFDENVTFECGDKLLDDFIKKIDIAIVCNSTVLYDCIFYNKAVYVYNINNCSIFNEGVFKTILINSVSDLENKLTNNSLIDREKYRAIKEYLIGNEDVNDNYLKALSCLGIKI